MLSIEELNSMTFMQLCWQAGFVTAANTPKTYTNQSGILGINIPALCDFLHCSERSARRWLKDEKPCPRAVALLKAKINQIPQSFVGFYFDRRGMLKHKDWRSSYSADELKRLPDLLAKYHSHSGELELSKRYIDELRDKRQERLRREDLLKLAQKLTDMANAGHLGLLRQLND